MHENEWNEMGVNEVGNHGRGKWWDWEKNLEEDMEGESDRLILLLPFLFPWESKLHNPS